MPGADGKGRRLVLLGDGLWAAVALDHLARGHQVLAVVGRDHPTGPDLAQRAAAHGSALRRLADANAPESLDWLRSLRPDLLLSVSYDQIFSRAFLQEIACPVLNLHAGHPGRHRGRAILTWQLLEGRRQVEVAVMRVTPGVDRGPLLALAEVRLEESDDYGRALGKVCLAVPALLDESLESLAGGRGMDEDGTGRPVYYPRRIAGDEWLDWSQDGDSLLRKIRALAAPNCLALTRLGGRRIRVAHAEPCPGFPSAAAGVPGSLIGKDPLRGLLVKTGDGALWVKDLREDDGRPLEDCPLRLSDRLGGGLLAEVESLRERVAALEARLGASAEVRP